MSISRRLSTVVSIAVLGIASCSILAATPLTLIYGVTPDGGGVYTYQFTLTLDNNDGTWAAGQNFNWIIFGDVAGPGSSNLTGFAGDSSALPIGPFTDYSASSGGHNGPTLLDTVGNGWIPTAIGQSLSWDGTSTADLGPGELLWSNLEGSGTQADFVAATLAPEPSSMGLAMTGLFLIAIGGALPRRLPRRSNARARS